MSKSKTQALFACRECGDTFSKWSGRCPSCGAWDSILEVPEADARAVAGGASGAAASLKVRGLLRSLRSS